VVFRHVLGLDTEAAKTLAHRLHPIFLAAGNHDQSARLDPLEGFRNAIVVLAPMLAEQHQRPVEILALDPGNRLELCGLQPQELAAMALYRHELRRKFSRRRKAGLRSEEKEAFIVARCGNRAAGKGVEQGFQRFAAHGRFSGRIKKARKGFRALVQR